MNNRKRIYGRTLDRKLTDTSQTVFIRTFIVQFRVIIQDERQMFSSLIHNIRPRSHTHENIW